MAVLRLYKASEGTASSPRSPTSPAQPNRLMSTCRRAVMPALMSRATPVSADNSALLHVLEAYIETLKAENESLKRQLAVAKARAERLMVRAAERERCPWWCRRLG